MRLKLARQAVLLLWGATFLPHDAMRRCGLCCRPVSVRPSVTLVYGIQDIVKSLSRPGSPIILVFDPQRRYTIPGKPLQLGVQNTQGLENFAIFD